MTLTQEQQQLVLENIGIAHSVAWGYSKKNPQERNEILSVAFEALCTAAARYDLRHESGAKFSTYAFRRVSGKIGAHFRDLKVYRQRVEASVTHESSAAHKTSMRAVQDRLALQQLQHIAKILDSEMEDLLASREYGGLRSTAKKNKRSFYAQVDRQRKLIKMLRGAVKFSSAGCQTVL